MPPTMPPCPFTELDFFHPDTMPDEPEPQPEPEPESKSRWRHAHGHRVRTELWIAMVRLKQQRRASREETDFHFGPLPFYE